MKEGWKTSSFWLVLLLNAIGLVLAFQGLMNPIIALVTLAVLNAVYGTLRSIDKIQKNEVDKPGYQTSEFVLVALYNIAVGLGALSGKIPANIATPIMSALTIVYNVLRQLVAMAAKNAGGTVDPEVPVELPKLTDATTATAVPTVVAPKQ